MCVNVHSFEFCIAYLYVQVTNERDKLSDSLANLTEQMRQQMEELKGLKEENEKLQKEKATKNWLSYIRQSNTECPKIYRKSVQHLLKYRFALYLK